MARRSTVATVLVVMVSFGILVVAGLLYTNYVQQQSEEHFREAIRQSEQKWCAVLGIFEIAYAANPPTTPTGRDVASRMHSLYIDFRCPDAGQSVALPGS